MRMYGRSLTLTAVTATILFLLRIFSSRLPADGVTTVNGRRVQHPVVVDNPGVFESIEDLWHKWSALMHESRPQSSAIFLKDAAKDVRHDIFDLAPRKPYKDLVANSKADIKSLRRSHAHFLQELARQESLSSLFNGYGVVTVAGGKYFAAAVTGIQMLRRTGCKLPVEVFVANDAEYEKHVCEEYLPKLNARCLVITHFLNKGAHKFHQRHYQLKALAILFTSFQHVLYLDSDSIPLIDPYQNLMKTEPYLSKGMVIWPDFWLSTESPSFYNIAGLSDFPTGLPLTASETGQILVNKRTHLPALLLATFYNVYGPNWFYPLLSQGAMGEGDKETFLAAAAVLRQPFWRVKTPVMALMNDDGKKSRGRAMVQYDCANDYARYRLDDKANETVSIRPAFLHANIAKMNAGRLIDGPQIYSAEDRSKHWRLLGRVEHQHEVFGWDIESALWELMESQACELQDRLQDWKGRRNLCERTKEHVSALFGRPHEEDGNGQGERHGEGEQGERHDQPQGDNREPEQQSNPQPPSGEQGHESNQQEQRENASSAPQSQTPSPEQQQEQQQQHQQQQQPQHQTQAHDPPSSEEQQHRSQDGGQPRQGAEHSEAQHRLGDTQRDDTHESG